MAKTRRGRCILTLRLVDQPRVQNPRRRFAFKEGGHE